MEETEDSRIDSGIGQASQNDSCGQSTFAKGTLKVIESSAIPSSEDNHSSFSPISGSGQTEMTKGGETPAQKNLKIGNRNCESKSRSGRENFVNQVEAFSKIHECEEHTSRELVHGRLRVSDTLNDRNTAAIQSISSNTSSKHAVPKCFPGSESDSGSPGVLEPSLTKCVTTKSDSNGGVGSEYHADTDLKTVVPNTSKQGVYVSPRHLMKATRPDQRAVKSTLTDTAGSSAFHASQMQCKSAPYMITQENNIRTANALDLIGLHGQVRHCGAAKSQDLCETKTSSRSEDYSLPRSKCAATDVSSVPVISDGIKGREKLRSKTASPTVPPQHSVVRSINAHDQAIEAAGSTSNGLDSLGHRICKKTTATSINRLISKRTIGDNNVGVREQNVNEMAAEDNDAPSVKQGRGKRKRGRRGRNRNGRNKDFNSMGNINEADAQ